MRVLHLMGLMAMAMAMAMQGAKMEVGGYGGRAEVGVEGMQEIRLLRARMQRCNLIGEGGPWVVPDQKAAQSFPTYMYGTSRCKVSYSTETVTRVTSQKSHYSITQAKPKQKAIAASAR